MTNVAVGLSKDLPNGRVMRAIVGEQDLVVWRSKSGVLSAWDNRCPHRGMRLSHGFVRGEALACVYHGWHYDKTATCRYIPAHPELEPPETIKAQRFSSTEKGGLIWVSIEQQSTEPSIPDNLKAVRSISFACPMMILKGAIRDLDFTLVNDDNTDWVLKETSDDQWMIKSIKANLSLHLFFQDLSEQTCKIHALANADCAPDTMKKMSKALEYIRRLAEKHYEVTVS